MAFKPEIILLDIEGTTTSIRFVKDILFPYVKNNLKSYLNENWETDQMKSDLKLLYEQSSDDILNKVEGVVPIVETDSVEQMKESVIENVLWQMSIDRKTKALKTLQGHIWTSGYAAGELKGHIYDDVVPCLKKWIEAGIKIYIYSSGSVEAQKLLFGHTIKGNLLSYFSGYFDTTIGAKIDSSSYENILKALNCHSEKVLFLTDMVKEADAASNVGITTIVLARDAPLLLPDYKQVTNFEQIELIT